MAKTILGKVAEAAVFSALLPVAIIALARDDIVKGNTDDTLQPLEDLCEAAGKTIDNILGYGE